MALGHTVLGDADAGSNPRYVGFLHGILGSRSNWRSIARKAIGGTGWAAVLVDLRLHGDSQDLTPPHTVARAAMDLQTLPYSLSALVGHSFGGKVALQFGSEVPVERLLLVDSMPGRRSPKGEDATNTLRMLRRLPESFPTRGAFVDAVVNEGYSKPIGQWLAMNLEDSHGFRLRFDLDGIEAMLTDYFALDLWAELEADRQTQLLIGGASPVFSAEDRVRAENLSQAHPKLTIDTIDGAGHWVHVERPDAVIASIQQLLR